MGYPNTKMNPKLLLVATLACLYVAPSFATIDLVFGSGAIGLGTAAGITGTTTTAGGALLLGALGATIGKDLILRELNRGRGGSSRRSGSYRRSSYRGRREALPEISDEEATRFITELLQEYQAAYL